MAKLDCSNDLHRAFKDMCKAQGHKMIDVVDVLLTSYLKAGKQTAPPPHKKRLPLPPPPPVTGQEQWAKPAFWETKKSKAQQSRDDFEDLIRAREALASAQPDRPGWGYALHRVQALERKLKLSVTDGGVGMPKGMKLVPGELLCECGKVTRHKSGLCRACVTEAKGAKAKAKARRAN